MTSILFLATHLFPQEPDLCRYQVCGHSRCGYRSRSVAVVEVVTAAMDWYGCRCVAVVVDGTGAGLWLWQCLVQEMSGDGSGCMAMDGYIVLVDRMTAGVSVVVDDVRRGKDKQGEPE